MRVNGQPAGSNIDTSSIRHARFRVGGLYAEIFCKVCGEFYGGVSEPNAAPLSIILNWASEMEK